MMLTEEVQAVALPVMGHRLDHPVDGQSGVDTARMLIEETPIP
jgi:hypothetical protein